MLCLCRQVSLCACGRSSRACNKILLKTHAVSCRHPMVESAPTEVGQTWHSQGAFRCIKQRKDPCLTAGASSSSTGKHLRSLSARRLDRRLGMRSGQRSTRSMTLGGALRLVRQCSCSLRHPFQPCLKKVFPTFQDTTLLGYNGSRPVSSRIAHSAAKLTSL